MSESNKPNGSSSTTDWLIHLDGKLDSIHQDLNKKADKEDVQTAHKEIKNDIQENRSRIRTVEKRLAWFYGIATAVASALGILK